MSLWYRARFKKPLAVFGLVAIMLQVNTVGFYLLLYRANEAKLSATVCEKRVPQCHAKCFLQKELNKSDDNAASSTSPEKHTVPQLTFSEYLPQEASACTPVFQSVTTYYQATSVLLRGYHSSIFNPPKGTEA